jgi:hypothetical protein
MIPVLYPSHKGEVRNDQPMIFGAAGWGSLKVRPRRKRDPLNDARASQLDPLLRVSILV